MAVGFRFLLEPSDSVVAEEGTVTLSCRTSKHIYGFQHRRHDMASLKYARFGEGKGVMMTHGKAYEE